MSVPTEQESPVGTELGVGAEGLIVRRLGIKEAGKAYAADRANQSKAIQAHARDENIANHRQNVAETTIAKAQSSVAKVLMPHHLHPRQLQRLYLSRRDLP